MVRRRLMIRQLIYPAFAIVLVGGSIAFAQVRTGVITGAVLDEQGAVMPGVTVTMTGERVLGEVTAVTQSDGTYRFRALEPGAYDLLFQLAGFQTLNRERIIVEGGRTITVNVTLPVASVAETVTVTGESPVVDVKQTHIGSTFDEVELYDVPSATDTWAVLGQTPGVRMRGFDVGGSHKSQQTGYESFGVRNQNQITSEGVNSTEDTGAAAIYYDYYAIEEYKISAAGADVEMMTPGAAVVMTVKSGGNTPSSLWHLDYEPEGFVADNVDAETAARGFTGNPNLLFWELHGDYGGPIVRDKAWIYASYNHFTIKKAISGVDRNEATDDGIFNNYTGKLTWQFTGKDKFVGYTNWMHKEKPNRELSAARPPESILSQDYWTWVHKAEWQRVWNDQLFTDLQVNHFGNVWPMVPKVDPQDRPARFDVSTGLQTGAGWLPFTRWRWKPHVNAIANYYVPDAAGSHDFKFGYHFQIDSEADGDNASSGPVRYRDQDGVPFEIVLTDLPTQEIFPTSRNRHNHFYAQDTWTVSDRLTLNLGFRYTHQRAYYLETERDPAIISSEWFPFTAPLFDTTPVPGGTFATYGNFAPRLGLTFDVTGEARTVLKFSYGRYNDNVSQTFEGAHPAGTLELTHQFNDLDGNLILSGPEELGPEVGRSGGGGAIRVDADAPLPHTDEFQFTLEHELAGDTAVRGIYVRKMVRNLGVNSRRPVNQAQAPFLTVPFQATDPVTGNILNLVTTPADRFGSDNVLTLHPAGEGDAWDYDTVVLTVERRFAENFFIQGGFDYQWRKEARDPTSISTSPLTADPINVEYFQNHNPSVPAVQETTNWGFKALARYVFPLDIAVSTNLRVQSGWPFSRRIDMPIFAGTGVRSEGARSLGTKRFFVESVGNNRSETVPIWDLRVDKSFDAGGAGQFMIMADLYNVLNSNAVTNFFLTSGSFERIIATLDPRTLKIGMRWTF